MSSTSELGLWVWTCSLLCKTVLQCCGLVQAVGQRLVAVFARSQPAASVGAQRHHALVHTDIRLSRDRIRRIRDWTLHGIDELKLQAWVLFSGVSHHGWLHWAIVYMSHALHISGLLSLCKQVVPHPHHDIIAFALGYILYSVGMLCTLCMRHPLPGCGCYHT